MTRDHFAALLLASLPERIIPAADHYGRVRATPGQETLAYGDYFAALMDLDARGLLVTNEVWGRGDQSPRITVALPHLDSPVR